MAITTTGSQVDYTGTNTANQVCPFPYLFFDNTDLVVTKLTSANVLTTLVLNTDYSVTGAGVSSGGSVTIFAATPTSTKITIVRDLPETQLVSLTTGDRLPASTLEKAFDKLTMLVQELSRGLNKALRFSSAVTNQPTLTPLPASVLGTDTANELTFTSTTGATGTPPYFLAATAAGQAPTFQTLPLLTSNRIGNSAVIEQNLANGAVTPTKIGGQPTTGQWVLGTTAGVVTWQLPSTASVADFSITNTKLDNACVTTDKLANNSVNGNKILDANITAAKLQNGCVDSTKIASNAVTTSAILDGSITNAKVATGLDASKLTTGTLPADRIAAASIVGAKLSPAIITSRELASGARIGFSYITSSPYAVTNLNLADATYVNIPSTATGLQIIAITYTPQPNSIIALRFGGMFLTTLANMNYGLAIFAGTTLEAVQRFVSRPTALQPSMDYIEAVTIASATSAPVIYSVRMWKYNDTTATTNLMLNGNAKSDFNGNSKAILTLEETKA